MERFLWIDWWLYTARSLVSANFTENKCRWLFPAGVQTQMMMAKSA